MPGYRITKHSGLRFFFSFHVQKQSSNAARKPDDFFFSVKQSDGCFHSEKIYIKINLQLKFTNTASKA